MQSVHQAHRGPASRYANAGFAAAAVAAAALYLYLGRGLTFFHDEWTFIEHRGEWRLDTLMYPHNEHWSLGLAVVYKLLLSTIGLRTYFPYLLVLVALHIVVALGVYRALRVHSGLAFAFAAGTLMLFLGAGHENLFWAFQIGFVGSTAAGVWAVHLTLSRQTLTRRVLAAVLLLVSVATQGTGLFFFAAIASIVIVDPRRRVDVLILVPAFVGYLAWLLTFGRDALAANRDPFTLEALRQVPAYVMSGAGNAVGAIAGIGAEAGLVVFVLLGAAVAWHMTGRSGLRLLAVAAFVGLVTQFAVTGLVRAQLGEPSATSSRYIYVAAVFVFLCLGGLLKRRLVGSGVRGHAILWLLWSLALVMNVPEIWAGNAGLQEQALRTRAAVTVIERHGATPALAANDGISVIPGRARLSPLIADYGSPLEDAIYGDIPQPTEQLLDDVLFSVVSDSFTVAPLQDRAPTSSVRASAAAQLEVHQTGECLELEPSGGDPQVVFEVRPGRALQISSHVGGDFQMFLSMYGGHSELNSKRLTADPRLWYLIHTPDVGDDLAWSVRIDPPASGSTRVCGAMSP